MSCASPLVPKVSESRDLLESFDSFDSMSSSRNISASSGSSQLRNYTPGKNERVERTYLDMHTAQDVQFVSDKTGKWTEFNHGRMTIMEAIEKLSDIIDESDPDVDVPNIDHAFQTAERIRKAHPTKEWFQLTGLIHDAGKLLAYWGEPQFAVVGDTFPVGCSFSDKIVYGRESFAANKDFSHPLYSTKLGMYKEKCGLRNVMMSWGHDEYLYRVLANHKENRLPEEALYVIRFHSFYPWHSEDEYSYLCDDVDNKLIALVREFNSFDLYSKEDQPPNIPELMPYYKSLIDKYIPGQVSW